MDALKLQAHTPLELHVRVKNAPPIDNSRSPDTMAHQSAPRAFTNCNTCQGVGRFNTNLQPLNPAAGQKM